jgi:molybdenum cofactor cytidylyltransferase
LTTGGGLESPFEALVLAAGLSSRFGGGKLLAPWRGGVLLDGALASAMAAPVRRVTVVWGADERVPEAARAWARDHGVAERFRTAEAAAHVQGLSASLKAGVAALAADCAGVFVFLGDMPRIPVTVLQPLALAVLAGAPAAAPRFGGRRGHPVLIGRALFEDLMILDGDRGAGDLLKRLGSAVVTVEAPDDGVLYDIDRPEDLG